MRPSQNREAPPGPPHSALTGTLRGTGSSVPLEAPATPALPRAEELLRQLMPMRVVAQTLGVSTATVERAIKSGQLPVLHFRRKRYVNIEDLVFFMRQPQRHTANQDLDAAIASILTSVQR
jgi:excisionase family DNA binding protein